MNIFIMKSVYFKELHNEQEYYCPTIYRAGAAVVSTITTGMIRNQLFDYFDRLHGVYIFFKKRLWGVFNPVLGMGVGRQ